MFQRLDFKHSQNGSVATISGWSYLWAALFGPLFLAARNFWGFFFFHLLFVQPVLIWLAAFLFVFFFTILNDLSYSIFPALLFCLVLMVPLYLLVTSVVTTYSAKWCYIRRGWKLASPSETRPQRQGHV